MFNKNNNKQNNYKETGKDVSKQKKENSLQFGNVYL